MTRAATSLRRAAGMAFALGLVLGACGPVPPPQAPAPPGEIVVLASDPDDGTVGELTVSNPNGTVDLTEARQSTTITAGLSPGPATVLEEAEIQRLFGPALAVQPPAARHFNLYFDVGSDTLTPDSKILVADVVALVGTRTAPDVSVVGHTDTTDTPAANTVLGLRRATLIRTLLVGAGLDAALIEVASHGESDLLVQTPDNTAEAKNRRVEVTVR